MGVPAKLSRYFLTRYARKEALPGMISACFLPGAPRNAPYTWYDFSLFLTRCTTECALYLVRFHDQTVTGGDGQRGTCQAFQVFSYQVCQERGLTWYDFSLFLTRYARKCALPGAISACFLPGAPRNALYLVRFHDQTVTGGDRQEGTCR